MTTEDNSSEMLATTDATEATTEAPAEAVTEETETAEAEAPEVEATETNEGDSSEPSKDGADSPAEPKKSKVQKRIDELTAKQRQAEREAEYWKEQAQTKKEQELEIDQPEKPTLEQFSHDVEAYEAAMADYAQKQAQYNQYQDVLAQKENRRMIEQQEQKKQFVDRANSFALENPDYYAVTSNPDLRISPEMATAIQLSDKGPEVAYHLAKNPDLSSQISAMPVEQQYFELGRIQAEISAKPVITPSKSPAPIKPIGSKSPVEKSPEQMSMAEYEKWRKRA